MLSYEQKGVTILLASHNRDDIELLCNEVFHMDHAVLDDHGMGSWSLSSDYGTGSWSPKRFLEKIRLKNRRMSLVIEKVTEYN